MSNRERLEAVYGEWAKGNFRAGSELLAPDVSFEAVPDGRRATGREALWTFREGQVVSVRWTTERPD